MKTRRGNYVVLAVSLVVTSLFLCSCGKFKTPKNATPVTPSGQTSTPTQAPEKLKTIWDFRDITTFTLSLPECTVTNVTDEATGETVSKITSKFCAPAEDVLTALRNDEWLRRNAVPVDERPESAEAGATENPEVYGVYADGKGIRFVRSVNGDIRDLTYDAAQAFELKYTYDNPGFTGPNSVEVTFSNVDFSDPETAPNIQRIAKLIFGEPYSEWIIYGTNKIDRDTLKLPNDFSVPMSDPETGVTYSLSRTARNEMSDKCRVTFRITATAGAVPNPEGSGN